MEGQNQTTSEINISAINATTLREIKAKSPESNSPTNTKPSLKKVVVIVISILAVIAACIGLVQWISHKTLPTAEEIGVEYIGINKGENDTQKSAMWAAYNESVETLGDVAYKNGGVTYDKSGKGITDYKIIKENITEFLDKMEDGPKKTQLTIHAISILAPGDKESANQLINQLDTSTCPNHPVTGDESSGYQTALPSNIGKYYAIFTLPVDANITDVNSIASETTSITRTPSNVHNLCVALNGHINNFLTEKCKSNEIVSSKVNINIPDEIGVKICVVSGVNYADSHGLPGATIQLADDKNNDAVPNANRSELTINSDYWKISGVSCETIKAKPRFQTWNAGFFTEGGVRMSVEQKVPSQIFSVGDASEPKLGFGSWSETSFIQGTTSAGFASSSKLGGKGMSDYSFCNSSAVSIANIEDDTPSDAACSGGNAIIESGIHSATTDTIEKTLLRYIPAKSDITNSCKDGSYCDLAPVGNNVSPGKYTYYTGNTKIDGFTLTLGGTETTRIIVVEGTAIITGNICIGSGGCESGGVLSTATRNTEPISDIKNLVNVIIIADEIRIDASVTQIDATLMALGTISGESSVKSRIMGNQGIINTCGAVNGTSVANDIKDDDNAITACRNTLLINGPLFAGKLIPNRTKYEVGPGALITPTQDLQSMGSSTPAEIFNLSPAVYFWAFEQSSRYTQANTVYTVELAPRM